MKKTALICLFFSWVSHASNLADFPKNTDLIFSDGIVLFDEHGRVFTEDSAALVKLGILEDIKGNPDLSKLHYFQAARRGNISACIKLGQAALKLKDDTESSVDLAAFGWFDLANQLSWFSVGEVNTIAMAEINRLNLKHRAIYNKTKERGSHQLLLVTNKMIEFFAGTPPQTAKQVIHDLYGFHAKFCETDNGAEFRMADAILVAISPKWGYLALAEALTDFENNRYTHEPERYRMARKLLKFNLETMRAKGPLSLSIRTPCREIFARRSVF